MFTYGLLVFINSFWPDDTVWWHRSRSILAQVMACWQMAPSHYLNQSWLFIIQALWYSSMSNFIPKAHATTMYSKCENHTFEITTTSPRGPVSQIWPHFWGPLNLHRQIIAGNSFPARSPDWRKAQPSATTGHLSAWFCNLETWLHIMVMSWHGNTFYIIATLSGNSTSHCWISLTKGQ